MKEVCISDSFAGLAVRDFNLSNPSINPIMGKIHIQNTYCLKNNPDNIYIFLCC